MHTENESKKVIERKLDKKNYTNWISFPFFLQKKRDEKSKSLDDQIKQWIAAHRSAIRLKLVSNSVTFSTVIAFFPLALGLFKFFSAKITSDPNQFGNQNTAAFLQKTLPIFANLTPKITTETLQYIIKSNSYIKAPSQIRDFGKNMAFLIDQPEFVAKTKVASFSPDTFTGLSCSFHQNSSSTLSLFSMKKGIARFFDELPSYVDGLNQNESSLESVLFQTSQSKKVSVDSKLTFKKPKVVLSTPLTEENTLQFLSSFKKETNKISLIDSQPENENSFYTDRFEVYQTVDQLEKQIQNLFIEKGFSMSSIDFALCFEENDSEFSTDNFPSPFLDGFVEKKDQLGETLLIDKILENLEKQTVSQETLPFRSMSGYKYPDSTIKDLQWFYKQTNFFDFLKRKPENTFSVFSKFTRPNFVYKIGNEFNETGIGIGANKLNFTQSTAYYKFRIQNWSSFFVETKQVAVKNSDQTKVLFKGPALVLDKDRALDWKNGKRNTHGNLRSWFHTYMSPWNPFTSIQNNFLGLSPISKTSLTISSNMGEELDLTNKLLLHDFYFPFYHRWALVPSTLDSTISPFLPSFHIFSEDLSQKDRLVRGLIVTESKNEKDQEQFIPIIQVQQPFFRPVSASNFSTKNEKKTPTSFLNQGYSSFFDLGITAKPDYLFSTEFVLNTSMTEVSSSGRYFKRKSVFFYSEDYSKFTKFMKATSKSWIDHWEPLTTQSWLVLSQLSFAVFLFQMLKSLAENYGRELLGYLLDLLASLGILDDSLKQEIELLLGQRDKGFRVLTQSSKTFNDIVGIETFLPELYEVVWFLRNSARDFALSHTLPRGILFTGPPGTGKTLLVQAIAGEAQVPVVVLSGSSLIEPGESASVKLEMVFQEARQLAPCIVFIDEIDTLAHKRSGVVHSPMGHDNLVDSLLSFENGREKNVFPQFESKLGMVSADSEKEEQEKLEQNQQQLSLLTQLLIELDGIQGRDGVIVLGATNRPEVIDPALLRPGRFEKVLQINLPHRQKRIEILQFYGQQLGFSANMPWAYLGERTAGFSAADLATLMNESTIKSILNQISLSSPVCVQTGDKPLEISKFDKFGKGLDGILSSDEKKSQLLHTIETIEHGIDRLTTSEKEKIKPRVLIETVEEGSTIKRLHSFSTAEKLMMIRLAYYQAGKIVISSVLEHHPKGLVVSLWPRRPTIRSVQIAANLQNSMFEFVRLCEITERLIGCYAGKAAEFLFLQQFSSGKASHLSTLGLEDLLFAQKLVYSLIEKSHFYSKKTHTQKTLFLLENINQREFQNASQKLDLYNNLLEIVENPEGEMQKTVELETSSLSSSETLQEAENLASQFFYSVPWWQQETSNALKFVEKNFSNWSRLYLSNPEQSERNPEWFAPDEFYHTESGLKNVKKAFTNVFKTPSRPVFVPKTGKASFASGKTKTTQSSVKCETQEIKKYPPQKVHFSWNGIADLTRDYPVHSLVLQSFNKAFLVLNQNRELLDRLASELLYHEILRQPEIDKLLQEFQVVTNHGQDDTQFDAFEKEYQVKILENSWGSFSRKPLPRWIDLADFGQEIIEETT